MNILSMNTYVKNLKTYTVEVTDKIYVDKPMQKQKEISFENQHAIMNE